MAVRQPPRNCPVCSERLSITRLGCDECGTELSGAFEGCAFCSLGHDDRDVLWVFLRSRGNIKEVERHLGVSYPTARARVDQMLGALGVEQPGAESERRANRTEILAALARGELDVDGAEEALRG